MVVVVIHDQWQFADVGSFLIPHVRHRLNSVALAIKMLFDHHILYIEECMQMESFMD